MRVLHRSSHAGRQVSLVSLLKLNSASVSIIFLFGWSHLLLRLSVISRYHNMKCFFHNTAPIPLLIAAFVSPSHHHHHHHVSVIPIASCQGSSVSGSAIVSPSILWHFSLSCNTTNKRRPLNIDESFCRSLIVYFSTVLSYRAHVTCNYIAR